MSDPKRHTGWFVEPAARLLLLERFPPRYEQTVAEHVTFKPGSDGAPMPEADRCVLVGRVDDGAGVEALVVAIGGTTDRPDGSTWHITWSLAEGRRAQESNDVIAALGWEAADDEIEIALVPGWWS